jgi:hypothetical protein
MAARVAAAVWVVLHWVGPFIIREQDNSSPWLPAPSPSTRHVAATVAVALSAGPVLQEQRSLIPLRGALVVWVEKVATRPAVAYITQPGISHLQVTAALNKTWPPVAAADKEDRGERQGKSP